MAPLVVNYCISTKKVHREICSGSCDSFESNKLRFSGMLVGEKVCKCCSADKTFIEKVEMNCGRSGIIEAEYERILSCKCNQCGGDKLPDLY